VSVGAAWQRRVRCSARSLPTVNGVTSSRLAFRGQDDLILSSAPLGRGIHMEDPHEGGDDDSSAFSFANF
jgi:hypothetical protein